MKVSTAEGSMRQVPEAGVEAGIVGKVGQVDDCFKTGNGGGVVTYVGVGAGVAGTNDFGVMESS
jgi:hypothetical protein